MRYCPYRKDEGCNRGCRGFQCRNRDDVIEQAEAEIAARQSEREPHYLRPIQASLLDPAAGVKGMDDAQG